MESLLVVFNALKFKDLIVVIHDILLQLKRSYVYNCHIRIFDSEDSRYLRALNLLEFFS